MGLISNVRLWKRNHDVVKASGKFTVAEAFDIAFTLISGKDGMFVSLPRRQYTDKKTGDSKWQNDVFCLSEDARIEMTDAVMQLYSDGGTPPRAQETAPAQTKVPSKKVPF